MMNSPAFCSTSVYGIPHLDKTDGSTRVDLCLSDAPDEHLMSVNDSTSCSSLVPCSGGMMYHHLVVFDMLNKYNDSKKNYSKVKNNEICCIN